VKFSGKVSNGPVNKRLNFGGDLEHRLDTGIVHYYYYKTKLESVSLSCKSHRSKTANMQISNFYPQIQRIDASDHIYASHRLVVNLKASFCA